MQVYRGIFTNEYDVLEEFKAPADSLRGARVLLAVYRYESYSGSAMVVYEKDGQLYEVNGSHCSCYGLEDQWAPELTSWEALEMRLDPDVQDLVKNGFFLYKVMQALAC